MAVLCSWNLVSYVQINRLLWHEPIGMLACDVMMTCFIIIKQRQLPLS